MTLDPREVEMLQREVARLEEFYDTIQIVASRDEDDAEGEPQRFVFMAGKGNPALRVMLLRLAEEQIYDRQQDA